MTNSSKSHQSQRSSDNGWLADLTRRMEAIYTAREATNPTPTPPPDPWIDKPGTLIAAEKDVLRWEMVDKLQQLLCGDVARCANHRCRRSRRCSKLEGVAPDVAASRANLAAERAKMAAAGSCDGADPPRGREKGRTGMRP